MTNGQKLAKNYLERHRKDLAKLAPTFYANYPVAWFPGYLAFAAFADHIIDEFKFEGEELEYLVENCGAANGCCHASDFLELDSIEGVHIALSLEIREALQQYESDGHTLSQAARSFLDEMKITNRAASCTPGWAKDAPEIDTSCGQA